jgi:2'-5' RNA ligase
VAIYPPADTVGTLAAGLDALGLGPQGRVPLHQVHLTLQFIGETAERDLPEIQESVARATAGLPGFDLTPIRLMPLPEGARPRLVAAQTDAPAALMEVQRRLVLRLARSARERPRERFLPHLTLLRFKAEAAKIDRTLDVAPFPVRAVCLMRSLLRPGGAEHVEVARVPLS